MGKKFLLFITLLWLFTGYISAQMSEVLTLESCYQLAETNYPLTGQKEIIERITAETLKKINAYWQPQAYLNAQATYQSEVTQVPIEVPGFDIPVLSKDQYKATLDVSQTIYDGGVTKQQRTLQQSNSAVEVQKVEVEVYKLHEKINQFYFSVLLADKNIQLIKNFQDDLALQKKKTDTGLQYGTASVNTGDILESEILKADQKLIEVQAARTSAIQMLSVLTGTEIKENINFREPDLEFSLMDTMNERPELQLFKLQENYSQQQISFLKAADLPKLSAFAQGGYGKPGLNFLDDEFSPFYIVGVKLNYPIWTGNTKKYDAEIAGLNINTIDIQKRNFMLNTVLQSQQQTAEINKLQLLIEKDKSIIELKTKIKNSASVQLENGVISATDFVTYLNDETEARVNLSVHEMQLLTAKINYLTTLGKIH